jgi:hypothetical protein
MSRSGHRRAEDRTGLAFPLAAGCAGTRDGGDDRLHPCVTPPVGTVKHRFEQPRPRTVRVFVCEAHAVGQADPRPLTDADRAELRRRRRRVIGSAAGPPPA